VSAVLQLWSAARSAHASMSDRREDVEALTSAENPAALLVAELDGHLIGAIIAGWDGWRGSIYRLAVRTDHRRKGVGLRLARAAEDYFRAHRVGRVTALVPFDDGPANGFWEAAGYPQDAEIGRRVRNI
jgi:ribosomal protein S18 acetylase RimI-like enzyme